MSSMIVSLHISAAGDEAISPGTEYRMCKIMSVMFGVAVSGATDSTPLGLRS